MNNHILINCPFDDLYENLFDAILFSIYFSGFQPRCALEIDNGAQGRLDKIYSIIETCDLGIHDISRTELNSNGLPRFNMPFEFGVFMGAKRFGSKSQKTKSCVVFDCDSNRFDEFISDISGQDIKAHNNNPDEVIRKLRNWFNTLGINNPLPGATAIISKYHDYLIAFPDILIKLNLTKNDVQYSDKTQIIEEWIKQNPI